MFVLGKFLFVHSFLNLRKVNVLIVCLWVNLLTSLTMRNDIPSFCLRQTKNVVVCWKIYDGKREVILNTKILLLSLCNDTVRTIRMGTVKWFMENDGTDYVLITYSYNGEMLDYKIVGHSGTAYAIRMRAPKKGTGLVVEQKVLDDCSLLSQYKDLAYTIYTH